MARIIAYVFGTLVAVLGIWGFVQSPVLGIFPANTLHSLMHLAIGIVLLGAAAWWPHSSSFCLKIFGTVYAILAILGFVANGDLLLGLIDNSVANSILHTLLGIVFLWAGFMNADRSMRMEEEPIQTPM
ncbi:MAG: DUF4383 domain-containing protein [Patescibacteria group bacterium]